jgi:hypothetical protein
MSLPSTRRQCLCFLLPCWHRVRPHLASSSLAPHHVGTMRLHAHARHVATTSHPLSSSPPRKAAATATSLLHFAARACTPVALPPRRAITSLGRVSLPGPRHHLSVSRRLRSAHRLRGLAVPTSLHWRRFLLVRRFLSVRSFCTSTRSLFCLILELRMIS